MKGTVYEQVGGLRPGRSAFDLSASKMFDCDLGRLIPVLIEDVLPGDVLDIGASQVTKMQPMVVPLYHRMDISYHVFFVPYRLLWRNWQKFITGGSTGDSTIALPNLLEGEDYDKPTRLHRYGLWDYAGFRMDESTDYIDLMTPPQVQDFIWRAYWVIWRDYYRDENLQPHYPGSTYDVGQDDDEQMDALDAFMALRVEETTHYNMLADKLAYRCWSKDYFTSALPWQQRGTSPAIPVSGTSSAVWGGTAFVDEAGGTPNLFFSGSPADSRMHVIETAGPETTNARNWANSNTVTLTAMGVDINDLRYAVQLQKWMERSARGGYRYNEYLLAHFGTAARDERLQRPEYIGGMKQPVITSEILQTSATSADSPQGTFAGHGMAVGSDFAGRYHANEHGILMGIMSIMPEAVYQQGVPRKWTRKTRFDYYSPEFAHLPEQEIKLGEVYWQNSSADDTRFGFQGAYDEYRTNQSIVCGKFASSLKYWTLSRIFSGAPSLNEAFLTTEQLSLTRRDAWAVPGVEDNLQGEFLVRWNNHIKALRPMPYIPDPGLIDHF